jgi:hypothetical protein
LTRIKILQILFFSSLVDLRGDKNPMTDPDPGGETLFCCNADAGGRVSFVGVLTMFSLGEDK